MINLEPTKIGLTGSIAMGKSTTADMFRAAGVPVHDSDAAVHALYARGGGAVEPVGALAPSAVVDGAIDRAALRQAIAEDPSLLKRIEAAVHPLVAADRTAFMNQAIADQSELVVFDVPLLFETRSETLVDVIVVVTASAETQRRRALARPGMTVEHFERILTKQTPDAEKRRRADFIVDTDHGLEAARRDVHSIVEALTVKRRAAIEQ